MKQIFRLLFSISLIGAFAFGLFAFNTVALANNDVGGDSSFQNQNTEFLPAVPTVPEEDQVDLFDDDAATGANTVNNLLDAVKNVINRVLGLLALIALVILIYTGIVMLINARDSKKLEEGYTTVKNVAIALVFIGISWLIVSFIFRAIGVFTDSN